MRRPGDGETRGRGLTSGRMGEQQTRGEGADEKTRGRGRLERATGAHGRELSAQSPVPSLGSQESEIRTRT